MLFSLVSVKFASVQSKIPVGIKSGNYNKVRLETLLNIHSFI